MDPTTFEDMAVGSSPALPVPTRVSRVAHYLTFGTAKTAATDPEPTIGAPMWSESLSSLGPGESVTIFAMRPATKPPLGGGNPELTATWPRLPQLGIWRKRQHVVLSEGPRVEMGWLGEGGNTRR